MEKLHLVRVLVHQPVYQGSGTKLNAPYLRENATQKNKGLYCPSNHPYYCLSNLTFNFYIISSRIKNV